MKMLALEFSSAQRSLAVVAKASDPRSWIEHEAVETGSPSFGPFEMIEQVLHGAGFEREQIDGLAVGLGPGSYTGIRAAIALAQGWQLGRGVKLQGVSSAECLAAQAQIEGLFGRVAVVIDAQRGEFYLAKYEVTSTQWHELQPLRLVSRTIVAECEQVGDLLIGPEVGQWFLRGRTIFPRAATLAKLALSRTDYISGENMEPIYLRQTSFVKAPPPRILPD
jgi:tRNA threonylcarbamoyl adenosine modification protein YeaZ